MKQKILLVAAVFFGILAFMFTYQQIQKERQKFIDQTEDVVVVGVRHEMAEDQKITKEDIEPMKVRLIRNRPNASEILWENHTRILGSSIGMHVRKGEALCWHHLKQTVPPAREGLTKYVNPGFRAKSIQVDASSSVTGLIRPTNYVDVVGTFRFPATRGDTRLDTTTLTLLQRVKVLACGMDMGFARPTGTAARGYSTVTLELTPKEAELLEFASQKGRLSLVLRGYEDEKFVQNLQSINWGDIETGDYLKKLNEERESLLKKIR